MLERLTNVRLDILNILQANGQPDIVLGHPHRFLFRTRQLLMRRGRGMDHQALGVPDIGEVRQQFDGVDEFLARLQSALDPKTNQSAKTVLEIFFGHRMAGIVLQPRIGHPTDVGMAFEETSHFEGVDGMLALAQLECFQSLQELECIEGTNP